MPHYSRNEQQSQPPLKLELVTGLDKYLILPQVQNLLQHALDHDGYLSIGEHIYLKLRAGQNGSFEAQWHGDEELAGAILAFREIQEEDQELYPGHGVLAGRQIVGYAQLLAQPHNDPPRLLGEMVVHPHLREQGIGRQLLHKLVKLGKLGRLARLDLWAYHASQPARLFAHLAGLLPTRTLHHMRLEASRPLPEYELPAGLRLRTFRPGVDDAEWLALNHLVFADHPENGSWTQADLEMRFVQPWFDPADFLIVEDEQGRMVGFNWTKRVPARQNVLYPSPAYPEIGPRPPSKAGTPYGGSLGEIYIVGLHPDVRGHGLGRGLTLLGLQHLRARGSDLFALYVDATNTPAVKLYYSLGFKLHHNDVSYTMLLR